MPPFCWKGKAVHRVVFLPAHEAEGRIDDGLAREAPENVVAVRHGASVRLVDMGSFTRCVERVRVAIDQRPGMNRFDGGQATAEIIGSGLDDTIRELGRGELVLGVVSVGRHAVRVRHRREPAR